MATATNAQAIMWCILWIDVIAYRMFDLDNPIRLDQTARIHEDILFLLHSNHFIVTRMQALTMS